MFHRHRHRRRFHLVGSARTIPFPDAIRAGGHKNGDQRPASAEREERVPLWTNRKGFARSADGGVAGRRGRHLRSHRCRTVRHLSSWLKPDTVESEGAERALRTCGLNPLYVRSERTDPGTGRCGETRPRMSAQNRAARVLSNAGWGGDILRPVPTSGGDPRGRADRRFLRLSQSGAVDGRKRGMEESVRSRGPCPRRAARMVGLFGDTTQACFGTP
jgi:hypothetical protein